jgi:hypothetical protein
MFPTTAFMPAINHSDLGQHLLQCSRAGGRLHRLRCAVEAIDAFLAPRFVTTTGAMTAMMLAVLTLLS